MMKILREELMILEPNLNLKNSKDKLKLRSMRMKRKIYI